MTTQLPAISFEAPPDGPRPGLDAALEFVNTTGISRGRPFDELASMHAAVHWLEDVGFLAADAAQREQVRFAESPAAGESALRRLRQVRAALRDIIDALAEERPPAAGSIRGVNAALKVHEIAQLVTVDGRLRLSFRQDGEPFDHALAAIARLVADELSEGKPDRFRVCQNDTCRWAFYDRSRPGTRRWCEMSSCGNRMKAARHRARHRAEEADAPPS